MASLFPDDPPSKPRPAFRKYPSRPKAADTAPPPLPEGWILAHCDGGSRGNPGPAGFGAVLVDAEGRTLAELSEFLGIRTNNFAEYSGLLAVLQWAIDHGHRNLRVISDSELMVKQIEGKYKVNSPDLRPLFEEARRRLARFVGFQIHHALRHKNKEADRLANEAMDTGMGRTREQGQGAQGQRATPYPARAAAPAPPSSFGGLRETPGPAPGRTANAASPESQPAMLRGFVRDGVVHILGGRTLPEGSFVKLLPE